jgi:hypothetical protein
MVLGRVRGERFKGFRRKQLRAYREGALVSHRDRGRGAELRAERIQRRVRSRRMSQASRNIDEHLRQMNEQASLLDKRLGRHGEEGES